ncbi:MAG TPA: RNA polymerase sigma factor [Solirubrobacterales bacterium]|nr:RNA polymerase sigma factor [Solirubrobacterales bacterium]
MKAARPATGGTQLPFQRFLDAHRAPVLAFLRAMVGPADADDVFQDTFIAAMRAYERMDGRHPRAWVMTIARRKAIDHHRSRARRAEPRAELPEVAVTDDHPDREVWAAVAELPAGQRAAVALRYGADLPYSEIAAALETSEAAARRRVADGLRTLRTKMDREEALR